MKPRITRRHVVAAAAEIVDRWDEIDTAGAVAGTVGQSPEADAAAMHALLAEIIARHVEGRT